MKELFCGAATALITPFCGNGIDYEAMEKIINFQIEEGINALVVCGTTGEVSTLAKEEKTKLIEFTVNKCAGRVPVIAGTGGNNTEAALEMSFFAKKAGADGILSVAPYYNKGTEKGITEHYKRIAEKCELPTIIYNVPTRTGVSLTPKLYKELSKIPFVCAIKESNGNPASWLKTAVMCDGLTLYSGNDSDTLPIMALGGKGVISVASNAVPKRIADMCRAELCADINGALAICLECAQLFDVLFTEVNPVPIKYAMWKMGFCQNILRLPLTECEPQTAAKIDSVLLKLGLIR